MPTPKLKSDWFNGNLVFKQRATGGSAYIQMDNVGLVGAGYIPPGKSFFVDPIHGAETNDGLSWSTAVKTIATAMGLCTTNHNDYIFCTGMPYNYAALSGETFPLVLAKNYIHIIGVSPSSWLGGRDSWNRLNGGGADVFQILPTGADPLGNSNLRGVELAGLHMQSTGKSGVSIEALTYGCSIHHCGFGDWGAITYGISCLITPGEFGWGTISDCFFGRQIATDGIKVGNDNIVGTFSWTNIVNNVFWQVAGVGINIANTSAASQGACIFDNRFFQKTAWDAGFAITIIAAGGYMIDGNHAMAQGQNTIGNNPYRDTSTNNLATIHNAWGLNYFGDAVTYPAVT